MAPVPTTRNALRRRLILTGLAALADTSAENRERLRAALAAGHELLVSSQDLLTVLWRDLDVRAKEATAILDPVRTRQIVRNLVRNAVRAAGRPAGVRVEVATEPDGQRVRIVVADDGPGLTPEKREVVLARSLRDRGRLYRPRLRCGTAAGGRPGR